MQTERSFDHLGESGERLPVVHAPRYLEISKESPAYPLMVLANIATYHAETNYRYSLDSHNATNAEQAALYRHALVPIIEKIFVLHTGLDNVGQIALDGPHAVEIVGEGTAFKISFERRWKLITTTGRHYYVQQVFLIQA